MKKRTEYHFLFLWALLIFPLLLNAMTEIYNPTMYDSIVKKGETYQLGKVMETYPPTVKNVYVLYQVKNPVEGDKIRIIWVAEKVDSVPENTRIIERNLTMKRNATKGSAQLSLDNPFPAGKYRIDFYVNGKRSVSKSFRVAAGKNPNSSSDDCGRVTQIILTDKTETDQKGIVHYDKALERFPTTQKTVHAVITYNGIKAPRNLEARWYAEKVGEERNVEMLRIQAKADRSDGVLDAEATKDDGPWLPGTYRIEVWCEGNRLASKSFEMVSPPKTGDAKKPSDSSCGVLSSPILTVTDVWLSKEDNQTIMYKGDGDRFPVSLHELIGLVTYKDATPPVRYMAYWIAEKVGNEIEQKILTDHIDRNVSGEGVLISTIQAYQGWDAGRYRLEFWCGDEKMGSKNFEMFKVTPAPTANSNPLSPPSNAPTTSQAQLPLGKWVTGSGAQQVVMEIPSPKVLIYDGKVYTCTMDGRQITVLDGSQKTRYPYRLEGDRLVLTFPNGSEVTFARMQSPNTPASPPASQPALSPPPTGSSVSGNLSGRFCSAATLGNEWIRFNGGGFFEYGSLQDLNTVLFQGKYRFTGDKILIDAGNGSGGTGIVSHRDATGSPDAFTFEGETYSKSLCPRQ